ncbi:MAG: imidazolonepropionase [Candidatus Angelobacter sp.]|jgi:imidazolonepropionase|nr:imidazolonepropionase [Candidatus Angelobacter sp.]
MHLLTNIAQLATLRGSESSRRGSELNDIGLITDAAVLSAGGRIVVAGKQREILRHPWLKKHKRKIKEINCSNKTVLPGFVDSHTHLVFAAPRLIDFEKRIAGATYQEIDEAGGGIRSSVAGVRSASEAKLADGALKALNHMLACGTTTVEAKSGYGLSFEAEMKSLRAIRRAAKQFPGTVVPTFLGAHVVPAELKDKRDEYVRLVCEKMVPEAAKKKLAQFVDVFCETSAFSVEECQDIFCAAGKHGLKTRAHIGQFTACALDSLLKFGPASLDHLDHVFERDLPRLAQSQTVATLVPGANYFLGHAKYPDARGLIDAGVAVALATDFNPGTSPTPNMQFILSLACTQMKMTPAEAITAATLNGAHALLLGNRKGSIEAGKDADMAVFDVKDYREIAYWFGENLCEMTIANGNLNS